jgi:hypothetical protein
MSIANAICGEQGVHRRASECAGFVFTFVRNPYDRFRSAFGFLSDPYQGVIKEPFESFVLRRGWVEMGNDLFRPMTYWIDAPVGFIGRYETLAEDFARLCRILGFTREIHLPHLHRGSGQYQYTQEMKEIVFDSFSDDFVKFNYGA